MAGKKDIIAVADALVTHFQSCLPAKLDTLDTEYNDGIILEDVPNQYYYITEKQKMEGFPLVCVIADNTDGRVGTGEPRYGIERHQLTIAVALVGNNTEEELERRTSRTLRGLQECIEDNRTLNCSVDYIDILTKQYGPLLTNGNALLQESQMTILAHISTEC
jgi:hypothetical protein